MSILVLRNSCRLCLTGFIWGLVFFVKAFAGMYWHTIIERMLVSVSPISYWAFMFFFFFTFRWLVESTGVHLVVITCEWFVAYFWIFWFSFLSMWGNPFATCMNDWICEICSTQCFNFQLSWLTLIGNWLLPLALGWRLNSFCHMGTIQVLFRRCCWS